VLADNLVGWDWFALQFNEGSEMMLFQLRPKIENVTEKVAEKGVDKVPDAGNTLKPSTRQGKQIRPDGTASTLAGRDLKFEPVRHWQDETGARWPVEWRIDVPGRELRVVAALDNQKMRSSIEYWEGLVWIYEGDTRVGQGYLEMTGYTQAAQGVGHNG